jgi:tRNA(Ile)-lysidine synthase
MAFFDELRTKWQATAVVLAHHADDQAETVLMRLLRGSGMTGLAGMPYCNSRGYIRPLLDITRAEIENHLNERGLVWREDGSNLDRSFLRNRIRHELLPLLEQYNPSVRTSLTTTAAILSTENDLLEELATQTAGQISHPTAHGTSCSISLLMSQPTALQRRIIRLLLSRIHGNLQQISFQHLADICRMAASERPNSNINLPRGIVIVKEYDALVFRTEEAIQDHTRQLWIAGPGVYQFHNNAQLTVELLSASAQFDLLCPDTACFDLDKTPFPWQVRTFLPGDRIQPLGMYGTKKVKNIFIDSKIPLSQRPRIPLVICNDELIWVCGLRTSHSARLDSSSSRIVKIVFLRPL